ncbi:hexosaminidase [Enterococcus sp. AZ194]|uniref:family 20 glycosylhydrolase n=1 Tax=Enterococcus sp. AZ194 TaxID=2774629 RepID=UPI003F1FE045
MSHSEKHTKNSFSFETWCSAEQTQETATISSWFEATHVSRPIKFIRVKRSGNSSESFTISWNKPEIEIRSSSMNGLFYGFLEAQKKGERKEEKVTYTPQMKERALMLDMGRKFYTKEWLFSLIEQMSRLKLNTLQLHFSDNEGFRIESESYPEIVSEHYLTKQEIREIIFHANKHYIQIIPELDTPGHLKNFLSKYPQWRLNRVGEPNEYLDHRALDITNPKAISAIDRLLYEYFDLFKESRYFHIGADEFIDFDSFHEYPSLQTAAKKKYGEKATGIELYIEYTNQLIKKTATAGFSPRVWSDGFLRKNQSSIVPLSKEVQITFWTRWNQNMASVSEYIKEGYEVLNFNDNYFYFVLGEAAGYIYPTAEKINKEWQPTLFAQNQWVTEEELAKVVGSSFAVWADRPEALSQNQVMEKLLAPLEAYAEKLWINEGYEC